MNVHEEHIAAPSSHFLMVRLLMLLRYIAMAPPALRIWLPTWCSCRPCWWRCSSVTIFFIVVFIADAGGMMPVFLLVKYVLITFVVSLVCYFMCVILLISALMGQ